MFLIYRKEILIARIMQASLTNAQRMEPKEISAMKRIKHEQETAETATINRISGLDMGE